MIVIMHNNLLIHLLVCTLYTYMYTVHVQCISVFLISSYGAPLAQRASYLPLHSSLFGLVAQLIMIILSVTALTLS